jgi:hypothetical protein
MKRLLLWILAFFGILHLIPIFWPIVATIYALIAPGWLCYVLIRIFRLNYLAAKEKVPLNSIPFFFWEKGYRW